MNNINMEFFADQNLEDVIESLLDEREELRSEICRLECALEYWYNQLR